MATTVRVRDNEYTLPMGSQTATILNRDGKEEKFSPWNVTVTKSGNNFNVTAEDKTEEQETVRFSNYAAGGMGTLRIGDVEIAKSMVSKVDDSAQSSAGGSRQAPTAPRTTPPAPTPPPPSPDSEEKGVAKSTKSDEDESPPPRKRSAPEEEVPEKIVVVTLQVIGARIKRIEDITIKIEGRQSDDDGEDGAGFIDIPLRKPPAEDKTSVIKSVKTEASNIDFFKNFAGEYVNVEITATSAATGGKMTITKEFKVPKRIVSDSSYLLQFNFSESAIRAKDATQGVPVIFGSRGAINFNKQPGTVQYIYYTQAGALAADMVEPSVTASGKTYEFFFDSEPLLVPVRIPQDAIKGTKKESRQGRRNLLKEADGPQEHWILLLGKAQDGSGAAPDMGPAVGGSPRDGDGGDDDGGSSVVAANVALRYVKFTTQEKYVILPNYKIDLAGSAFALATDLEGAPEDRSERTLTRGMVDEDDIREAVYNALFKTSAEYKQMSGQFSDNLSPTAQRSIVKCWVEGPTVSGFRGVTAREESRYRG